MSPRSPEIHPAALVFPEMSATELQELADDIKQNGLMHPIVRIGDIVIDGRNRLRACEIAGVEPRYETYKGNNPVGLIVSANMKRRHLNESQRALVAAKLATLKLGDNQHTRGGSANLPVSQAAASALLNISERSVRHAAIVRDCGKPELIKDVEQGKLSVSAAAKQAKPKPKLKPKPAQTKQSKTEPPVSISVRQPVSSAYSKVQGAETMDQFRKALERLIKVAEDVLEKTR